MTRATGLLAAALLLALPAPASAAWHATAAASTADAAADTLPAGLAPTVSVTGRDVTVTWSQVAYHGSPLGALAAGSYAVTRTAAAGGTAGTPAAGCATAVAGSSATLSCTERGVAPGSWTYADVPAYASWRGAASPASAAATVAAPSLAVTSASSFRTLPATVTATVAGFLDRETLRFRLDDPASGTLLTASPSAVPASGGTATATITVPAGIAGGAHTIYAVGGSGSQASASVGYATPPVATGMAVANGPAPAPAARPSSGDTVTLTFDQPLDASTICGAWLSDTTPQSATGVTATLTRSGATNVLSVSSASSGCGTLHVGALTGLPRYVASGSASFTASAMAWSPAARQLTLTLGTTTASLTASAAPSTATFTPDPALASVYGTAISPSTTVSQTGVLF